MPADGAESGGTAGLLVSGNTEMVVLNLKSAFSKMENPLVRRSLPPVAGHPGLETVFAKRWRAGKIAGRITVDCHKASAGFQATGDPVQHRREFFPTRGIIEQVSRDGQIMFFVELQISAVPDQVADALRVFRLLLTGQGNHLLGEIHTRYTGRALLPQDA